MPGLNSWGPHQQGSLSKRETPLENRPDETGKLKKNTGASDGAEAPLNPDRVTSFASGGKSGDTSGDR